jgi:hypothetical protein
MVQYIGIPGSIEFIVIKMASSVNKMLQNICGLTLMQRQNSSQLPMSARFRC